LVDDPDDRARRLFDAIESGDADAVLAAYRADL
jgi:ketosteroid isomerase-like protein